MKKKIKIIHIVQSLGGVDTSMRMITKFLDDNVFELVLIKDKNENCEVFRSRSGSIIKTYEINFTRNINLIKDAWFLNKIVKIIKKERAQIIHSHSAKCGILGRIAGYLLTIPSFCTPQAFSYLSADSKITAKVYFLLEKLAKYSGGKIIACSISEKDRAINDIGFKEEDVYIFPNSLPISEKTPSAISMKKLQFESEYICTIGRPSYQKNTFYLIKVFYEMKKIGNKSKLVILGVGHYSPDLNKVENLISELNLKNDVILVQWSSREETLDVLAKASCYISFSRYEGLPFAVLEAMRSGKPCVISNVDGNKDCIENNINGFLVNFDDEPVEMVAQKVHTLVNSKTLLESFGEKSKLIFEERFNIETNIRCLEKIYKDNIL